MSWFLWLLIISYILLSWGLMKVFAKAGEDSWKALVPGYNLGVLAKIVGRSPWHALWMLVPIVNVFIFAGLAVDMVRSFGKYRFLDSFLAVVAAPLYALYLGHSPKEKYIGAILPRERAYAEEIKTALASGNKRAAEKLANDNPYKKGQVREWTEAIVFAVFAAALIRLFLIEAYVIPTSSMEGSLMTGDFLFVSKAHYGIRTPETVAMIPLLHNRIGSLGKESYWEQPSLKPKRLPAIEEVGRNSPVVFNLPAGDSVYIFPDRTWSVADYKYGMIQEAYFGRGVNANEAIKTGRIPLVTRPVDKRDHYIKRCIGAPGDSLQVINRQVYINGQAAQNPTHLQFLYVVTFPNANFNTSNFADWGLSDEDVRGDNMPPNMRLMFMSNEQKEKVQAMDPQIKIENFQFSKDPAAGYNPNRLFPHDAAHFGNWTVDDYGPIWVPKKGVTVDINMNNIAIYQRIIGVYEGNQLAFRDGQIFINGKAASRYTFKMNYYWMMGDNRHNSEDSRVWGFVPEDHIVGKPLFIWFSLREGSFKKGINWSRIFTSADKR